jgi:hypothetical protein
VSSTRLRMGLGQGPEGISSTNLGRETGGLDFGSGKSGQAEQHGLLHSSH